MKELITNSAFFRRDDQPAHLYAGSVAEEEI